MYKGRTIRFLKGEGAGQIPKKYSNRSLTKGKNIFHKKTTLRKNRAKLKNHVPFEEKICCSLIMTEKKLHAKKIPPPPLQKSNSPSLIFFIGIVADLTQMTIL